jgi:hypothetical protein
MRRLPYPSHLFGCGSKAALGLPDLSCGFGLCPMGNIYQFEAWGECFAEAGINNPGGVRSADVPDLPHAKRRS